MRLRELLSETPVAILKALGGMISGATKAKHYPTGNLDQLKRIHQSANTATKAGTATAKHTELADAIAMRDLATQNAVAQRNVLGKRVSIKHNKELEAAENKLLDMQKTINDKTNDLLINKDLGPTQPSNSGMARWNDHSDTQGVLSGSSKGSISKYATPAEHRRYGNLQSREWHRNRIANSTPEELAAHNAKISTQSIAVKAKRRANMTPEELAADKAKEAAKSSKFRADRTPEEKAAVNTKQAAVAVKKRANMTPEEKAAFNAKRDKAKMTAYNAERNAKIKAERMKNDPVYAAKVREKERRANMTPEEKAADTRAIRAARAREKTLKNKNKKK
jgi:hypothetical protein